MSSIKIYRLLIGKIQFILMLSWFYTFANGSGAYMNALRNTRNASSLSGTKVVLELYSKEEIDYFRCLYLEKLDEKFAKCNGVDIREISILELQKLFATKRLNSVELTKCYLQRIYHMNEGLRCVVEVNPDAVNIAHYADVERKTGRKPLSPLHGIPVLIKDNTATNDLMETTAGSWALLGIRPERDADVVWALRKSGAVIIGKANLSEMSNFRGTNIPNGWSGRGGQTRNPYNLLEDPEGSSSGSAVAVASNLVTVSVGTETDGSLICPAGVASVCTIRATLGLLPTRGVIPISHNQDVVGPMARNIKDLAVLFDGMFPPETRGRRRRGCDGSYLNCIIEKPFFRTRFRLGILRFPFWDTSVINSTNLDFELPLLENILETMKKSSKFEILDNLVAPYETLRSLSSMAELTVLLHDFKHDINEYLKTFTKSPFTISVRPTYQSAFFNSLPRRISSLSDIIQFNVDHPSPEGYNQDILVMAEETDGLQNVTYIKAREENRRAARSLLDEVLNTFKLDAIVVPSECRHEGTLDEALQDSVMSGNSVSAIAGYPSISVPAGIGLNGVPFGINFIGKRFSESKLFRIAYIAEQLIKKRASPRFMI